MIYPKTITEQLMFSTIRLQTVTGTGTGYFFNFKINNINVPIIITNKHVINHNEQEKVNFSIHIIDNGKNIENINIDYDTNWIFHKEEDIDLCFCFINPLIEQVKQKLNKNIFFIPLDESLILDNSKLEGLSAVEDILMIGYPIGLIDEVNKLPVFRKGITASHPSVDFNGEPIGLSDIGSIGGSSGSPVLIINEGSYNDKNGNLIIGQGRVILLGIHFEGYLSLEELKAKQNNGYYTGVGINIGRYIKANKILDFKEIIKSYINDNRGT